MINATCLLLALLVVVALWTIQATILRAAIGLAVVSVLLTLVMFQMGAPLAAVFELSVCAGLITAVFVSAISLMKQVTPEEEEKLRRIRARRLRPAFVVAAIVGALLWPLTNLTEVAPAPADALAAVRDLLWSARRLDLLGQIIIIFVGVYGVVVLFKERQQDAAPQREVGK